MICLLSVKNYGIFGLQFKIRVENYMDYFWEVVSRLVGLHSCQYEIVIWMIIKPII